MSRHRRTPGPFAANFRHAMWRHRLEPDDLCFALLGDRKRVTRLAFGETEPHYAELPEIARAVKVAPADLAWMPVAAFVAKYPATPR